MNWKALPARVLRTASRFRFGALTVAGFAAAAAISAGAQTTNGTDFASFQVISQRNIFNQNRLPHLRARVVPPVVDSFAFVGTMSYAKGQFAFFNGSSSEFRKALQVNGEIAHFKVAGITPKSVTLTDGTNQVVLNLQMQMRRDDSGHWTVSSEPASYASADAAPRSRSGNQLLSTHRGYGGASRGVTSMPAQAAVDDSRVDDTNLNGSEEMAPPETEENQPAATSGSTGGGANDALSRLMQRRAQEEQRLGR